MDRCRGATRPRFVEPSSQKRHGIRARRLLSQSGLAGQSFDRLAPPLSFGIRLPAHPDATARRWRQAWGPSRAVAPAAWRPNQQRDHTCDVAARMVEVSDEALSHRIGTANEDDRNRCGCGYHRATCQNIPDDDGQLPTNEIGCQSRQPIRLIVAPAIVDGNVLALDKSGVLQTLLERGRKMFRTRSRCAAEKANHWHR